MELSRIAWRNLHRNKVRTLIAVLAIVTVVCIVVFARGLIIGFVDSSFDMYIDYSYGHVRITQEEYNIREALLPLNYTVDGLEGQGLQKMLQDLEQLDGVESVLPRVRFGAMFSGDDQLVRMLGVGMDPDREQARGILTDDIIDGRMPEEGNEILVGKGLLEELKAEKGDRVTFVFSDSLQSLRGRTFEIVGISEAGIADLDNHLFYLPLNTAQEMLWLEGEATELMVFTRDSSRTEALEDRISGFLSREGGETYEGLAWYRADSFVEFYYEVTGIMDLVYVFFILLGAVVMVSVLTMIVRERTSEIGMMGALGLRSREIMKVFVMEGAFMGILGSFLGVIIGGLITFYYSREGLYVEDFAKLSEEMDLLIDPAFYLNFSLENLLYSFVLGVVVVTLSCLYPALKAARLKPVEALHSLEE